MTEGTIAEWMVKEGEAFTRGQILCLIETDKITNEVEAEVRRGLEARSRARQRPAAPGARAAGVFADPAASDAEVDAFVAAFKPAETGVAAKAGSAEAPAAAAAPSEAPKADAPPRSSPTARSARKR